MPDIAVSTSCEVPGADVPEALRMVLGELGQTHRPAVPVFSQQGVKSTLLARSLALLPELPTELTSYGWRLCDRPGQDLRRAQARSSAVINDLADVVGENRLHVHTLVFDVLGPVSVASKVFLPGGERAVSDVGALRDIAAALGDAYSRCARLLTEAAPGARLSLRLIEDELPHAEAGDIPTVSGYRKIAPLNSKDVAEALGLQKSSAESAGWTDITVSLPLPVATLSNKVEALAETGVRSFECLADSLTRTAPDLRSWERLAGLLDQGLEISLKIDTHSASAPDLARRLWHGFSSTGLPASVVAQLILVQSTQTERLSEFREQLRYILDVARGLAELAA